MNNRDKIIWDWQEDISINEQHIDKEEEQETHEQEHQIIYN